MFRSFDRCVLVIFVALYFLMPLPDVAVWFWIWFLSRAGVKRMKRALDLRRCSVGADRGNPVSGSSQGIHQIFVARDDFDATTQNRRVTGGEHFAYPSRDALLNYIASVCSEGRTNRQRGAKRVTLPAVPAAMEKPKTLARQQAASTGAGKAELVQLPRCS
jgi:hypothetical protein